MGLVNHCGTATCFLSSDKPSLTKTIPLHTGANEIRKTAKEKE